MPLVVSNSGRRSAPGLCAAFPYTSRAHRSSAAWTLCVLLAMVASRATEYCGGSANAFGVSDGVPECTVGPFSDALDLRERFVHFLTPEKAGRDDGLARELEDRVEVFHERRERFLARAGAEEQPGGSHRARAGLVEERHEAPPHDRIVSEAVVRARVRLPERTQPRRFGPDAEHVVIVVLQDDASARPHRTRHRAYDRKGIGHVFQDEPRMGEVVRGFFHRRAEDVALAHLEQ